MHPGLMALALMAAAPTVEERVKSMTGVAAAPDAAPVDDRLSALFVDENRLGFATDSRAASALYEEEFPAGKAGPTLAQRVEASGFTPRLKAAARGGIQRVNVVVDARARVDLMLGALQAITDAGLEAQLVDARARPWRRWFLLGMHPCHEGSVKDCLGDPDGCEPTVCAQLGYALQGKGVMVSATRRLKDETGACLERAGDAAPMAPAPWDGLWLKGDKDMCPPVKTVGVETLKTFQSSVASHLAPCETVGLQLRGDEEMTTVAALLNALSTTGATVITVDPPTTATCGTAQSLAALDARPAQVSVEAERVTGALKQNAVMGVLRAQRAALVQCVTRARMEDPDVKGTFKASLRVLDSGSVLSVKWDAPPPGALKGCFDGVLKGATFDRAARSSDIRVSVSSEK